VARPVQRLAVGRRSAGIELEPHYCDVVVARWEAFTGDAAVRDDD
jgi:hypothetical protein